MLSVRKQVKIRPGFTPQEDVRRFRGTRQAQADATALPKGHIIGWAPPSAANTVTLPQSASAKKNAKRKEKRATAAKTEGAPEAKVADSWEDEEDGQESAQGAGKAPAKDQTAGGIGEVKDAKAGEADKGDGESADALAGQLEKLEVR